MKDSEEDLRDDVQAVPQKVEQKDVNRKENTVELEDHAGDPQIFKIRVL